MSSAYLACILLMVLLSTLEVESYSVPNSPSGEISMASIFKQYRESKMYASLLVEASSSPTSFSSSRTLNEMVSAGDKMVDNVEAISRVTRAPSDDIAKHTVEQPLWSYHRDVESVDITRGLEAAGDMAPPMRYPFVHSLSHSHSLYEQMPSFSMLGATDDKDDSAQFEALYARYFEL